MLMLYLYSDTPGTRVTAACSSSAMSSATMKPRHGGLGKWRIYSSHVIGNLAKRLISAVRQLELDYDMLPFRIYRQNIYSTAVYRILDSSRSLALVEKQSRLKYGKIVSEVIS